MMPELQMWGWEEEFRFRGHGSFFSSPSFLSLFFLQAPNGAFYRESCSVTVLRIT